MKINNPFGMIGYLVLGATYRIGKQQLKAFPTSKSGAAVTVPVEWDSFDSIQMELEAEFKLDSGKTMIGGNGGRGEFSITAGWRASFSDKGVELKRDGNQPRDAGHKVSGNIVVSATAKVDQSDPGDKKPYVEMSVSFAAGEDDAGLNVGFSKVVTVGGVNIGGSKAGSGSDMVFRIDLKLDQPAKEKVPPPRIPPSLLAPEPILFKEDQDTLSGQSIRELHAWVGKVKDHESRLGYLIQSGTVPIEIQAFASPTGTKDYDKRKTDQRLASVEKILRSSQYFGSSQLKFKEKSHGHANADGKGPKNEFNRRVEIMINAATAKQAVEKYASQN
jgi:hypothetical protein